MLLISMLPQIGWCLAGNPQTSSSLIHLKLVTAHTFTQPLLLTALPGSPRHLLVVEQGGQVFRLVNGKVSPKPYLDITSKLRTGGERGLLGLAFHPHFTSNGRLFVNYTRAEDGGTVIAEYRQTSNSPEVDSQERILLVIPQPYSNHNGGMMAFGPDSYLYIGMGDGGSGGDPENHAQNPDNLLGKFLRLDVDHSGPYGIPPDNPLVGTTGRPEIFALGVRNPWRFSFDRETGELWAGDVGQDRWEEINIIQKGKNYGWRLLEGTQCYSPDTNCRLASNLVEPVTEYKHEQGRCSVIGGYVYRGKQIPALWGTYIFGDFCTGEIWGLKNGLTTLLIDSDSQISSFGEDSNGEIYVVGYEGHIRMIVPPPASAP